MSKGKINMQECEDKTNKRPHFKGFVTLADGSEFTYALWPARSGNGFSGTIEPKQDKPQPESTGSRLLD